jgi:hypothetical protein
MKSKFLENLKLVGWRIVLATNQSNLKKLTKIKSKEFLLQKRQL